ncbi:MAG: methyltransferase family protein, partial [Planctomycetota bacterium]
MSQLSPETILQTGTAFWASKTLLAAVGMNLFGALASGPKTAEELRTALGLHERGALDFFDALHALGFLTRDAGRYGNTPETAHFLIPGEPAYIGGMLAMCEHRLYRNWDGLADSLRTGKPQRGEFDEQESESAMSEFDLLYATPEKLRGFLEAMTGISLGAAHAMAAAFPFAEYQTVIDVGCAQGGMPVAIAQHHAHLSGGGF